MLKKYQNNSTMSKKPRYQDALDELQRIIQEMESGVIPVDQLSGSVKRAAELIKICRSILSTTEEDVNSILQELETWKKLDDQS
jgi:exodeoxyribonuclease VII small subunit